MKKRSSSSSPITSSHVGHVPEVKRPKKNDETGSIFFSKRENPAVIFGEIDDGKYRPRMHNPNMDQSHRCNLI